MTNTCKAELLMVLYKEHKIFAFYEYESHYEVGIRFKIKYFDSATMKYGYYESDDFDHAIVLDAVHAWLMRLREKGMADVNPFRYGIGIKMLPESLGDIWEGFNYPLSVAIWNVTEFVLKEMGDK